MTYNPHRFVITSEGSGRVTDISLDGVALKGVTRAVLIIDPSDMHEPTRLELEFIPGSIEVKASGTVSISGRDVS